MSLQSSLFIIEKVKLNNFIVRKESYGNPDDCQDLRKFALISQSVNSLKKRLPISCYDVDHSGYPKLSLPDFNLPVNYVDQLMEESRLILNHMILSSSSLNPLAPSFYPKSYTLDKRSDLEYLWVAQL